MLSSWVTPSLVMPSNLKPNLHNQPSQWIFYGTKPRHWPIQTICTVSFILVNSVNNILKTKYSPLNSFFLLLFVVVVYNCLEMGNTCKTCFTLPAKFNCGWCKTSSKCGIADQCTGDKAAWLNRQQTCP